MKPELQKVINLFEELQVAGETVSLTILSREGKSTIKLQLESPPSPSSTTTSPTPTASTPAPGGRRRRHRGAAARARRRQRAADHQGTTLAVPASASPLPPAPGVTSAPAGPQHAPSRHCSTTASSSSTQSCPNKALGDGNQEEGQHLVLLQPAGWADRGGRKSKRGQAR